MKKTCVMAVCLIVLFGCAALAAPMKVKVSKVKGTVEVQSGAAWKALKNGDSVPVGADVRTGSGSSCILTWAGGNVVKLNPMTTLSVSADKSAAGDEKSSIALKNGGVSAHAKKLSSKASSFEVKTPTAVAGVRGTDILAEIQAGNVTFGVSDGNLEVTVGDAVFMVEDGFLVNVSESGEFEVPVPIPPEMQQKLQQEFEEIKAEAQDQADAGEDGAAGDEGTEDEGTDDQGADEGAGDDVPDDVADAVNDTIQNVLDNEIINDVVEEAGSTYITGDVEVTIDFEAAQ